jgi:hypothetical protein
MIRNPEDIDAVFIALEKDPPEGDRVKQCLGRRASQRSVVVLVESDKVAAARGCCV